MKTIKLRTILAFILLTMSSSFAISQTNINKNEDFKVVGFHLDLRIQVMKPDALKDFASELASFGINTLLMEWEATFPFETHPIISNKYAYTKDEIDEFISHCEKLNIDVIPLQQSLGHMEYILRHARYADQREDHKEVSQICPLEPELNKELLTDLITEMAEAHPSEYFHIGGDEAYLLGHCDKCREKVEKEGIAKLIADHLKMVCEIVVSLDKIPVLWSDIATTYPEELSLLPKETVFMVWNYGWALDRFGDPEEITKRGFDIWGAPALRSSPDNFYLTCWDKHIRNIRDFIPMCRDVGYKGVIMTSWSTSGEYSTVFEDKQTITDLIPIRNVYPISGFRILVAAYAQGFIETEGLDIENFIVSYCNERFGLDKKQSLQFWKALKGMPYQVIDGRVENNNELTVAMLLDSARQDQKTIHKLMPLKNQDEFAHFKLMSDIRENYLSFKQVEVIVNSREFNKEMLPEVLSSLESILEKDKSIKTRFTDLNSYLLYSGQIEEENQTRIKRVQLLYDRLLKQDKYDNNVSEKL